MLFNSFSFLIFFPIVFLVYWILPHSLRRLFLLVASCYFYASLIPKYIFILFFIITADYFLAFLVNKQTGKRRALFLMMSILINIGTLFLFKYFNFFNENIGVFAKMIHWNYTPSLLTFVLPLGLSFHVFQSLSYMIEVYRKNYSPEKNFITYALYVMFFPQLVAGPIERPAHLLPQLSAYHKFDPSLARKGLERMLWGFFKKLVIADQIAQIINPLFTTNQSNGLIVMAMAVLFTYQLYCDFSGYTDIALGTAMMLGISLRENFNRPFAASSFTDFWHRWHMSLSTWFRDYVYFSLGGSKVSKIKWIRNLLITFFLSGFWHGANWTFIVWGLINGVYLIFEQVTRRVRNWFVSTIGLINFPKLNKAIHTVVVFSFTSLAFLFFRAVSISQAWFMVSHIFSGISINYLAHSFLQTLTKTSGNILFAFIILSIVILEVVQYFQSEKKTLYIFDSRSRFLRYGWYYCLAVMIILFGYFDSQSFIYFQF